MGKQELGGSKLDMETMSLAEALRPTDPDEAAEAVRWAADSGTSLEILGADSKRGLGAPLHGCTPLKLDRLLGIATYEPEELILTARPGTPLTEIEALLGSRNQMLAFEPPDWGPLLGAPDGRATLGGIVAANASGPRRVRAGAARDHMLGVTAISGRGETFKAGGQVVKNVTGYDLPKLLAGSFGTLAVMTELTVKVMPRPEGVRTLVFRGLEDRAAIRALRDAASTPYEPSGLAHLPAEAAARLGLTGSTTLVRLEGAAATLTYRIDHLAQRLAPYGAPYVLDNAESVDVWRAIRDVLPFVGQPGILWRVSVPPLAGPEVASIAGADSWFYDWAGGLVWLLCAESAQDAGAAKLRAAVARAGGGHATLFRAPEALRLAIPIFEPEPEPLAALSRRVKAAFDPAGILNPGRTSR